MFPFLKKYIENFYSSLFLYFFFKCSRENKIFQQPFADKAVAQLWHRMIFQNKTLATHKIFIYTYNIFFFYFLSFLYSINSDLYFISNKIYPTSNAKRCIHVALIQSQTILVKEYLLCNFGGKLKCQGWLCWLSLAVSIVQFLWRIFEDR